MKTQRIIGYDVIRIVSAFMVVAIHNNVSYLTPADGSIRWLVIMGLTALCVVAVPLFFMVSGAGNLVQEQVIPIRNLYCKKIPRQFTPFVVWSLIYVIIRMVTGKIPVSVGGFVSLIWEPAYYQFWFMYTLLGLYVLLPVFQYLVQKAEKKLLEYILLLWIISSVILPCAVRYIPGLRLSSHWDFVFLEGYWGYFLLGGYLRKYPIKNWKSIGISLLLVGLVSTWICSYIEWKYEQPYYGYVYGAYLLPGAVMASVGAFILCQEIKLPEKIQQIVRSVSSLTMGVFYIHMLVLVLLEGCFENLGIGVGIAIARWLVTCLASVIMVMVIKQIKIFRGILTN